MAKSEPWVGHPAPGSCGWGERCGAKGVGDRVWLVNTIVCVDGAHGSGWVELIRGWDKVYVPSMAKSEPWMGHPRVWWRSSHIWR